MKLKLDSDFRDYGDEWFDLEGEIFHRRSDQGMSRPEMLAYLDHDYLVPAHGWVKDIPESISNDRKLVVYTDLRAHRGEGKQWMYASQAKMAHPDAYYSVFIEPSHPSGRAVSFRLLRIGKKRVTLKYSSADDDWRSNCGDVEIKVLNVQDTENDTSYPLFAIDFVESNGVLYAVDFNTAPGLRGTGIEDHLTGSEVVGLIKEWHETR